VVHPAKAKAKKISTQALLRLVMVGCRFRTPGRSHHFKSMHQSKVQR